MSSYILCNDLTNKKSYILNVLCGNIEFVEQCNKILEYVKVQFESCIDKIEYIHDKENNTFIIQKVDDVVLKGWVYNTLQVDKVELYKLSLIEIHNDFTNLIKDEDITDSETSSDIVEDMPQIELDTKYFEHNFSSPFSYFSDNYKPDDNNDDNNDNANQDSEYEGPSYDYFNNKFSLYYDFVDKHANCNVFCQTEPSIVYDTNLFKLIPQSHFIDKINNVFFNQSNITMNPWSVKQPTSIESLFINELKEKLKMPNYNLKNI